MNAKAPQMKYFASLMSLFPTPARERFEFVFTCRA